MIKSSFYERKQKKLTEILLYLSRLIVYSGRGLVLDMK